MVVVLVGFELTVGFELMVGMVKGMAKLACRYSFIEQIVTICRCCSGTHLKKTKKVPALR